ncbi:MAG: dephospho-CoA kinase [Candidatus Saccharimonadales bacterium]
MAHHENVKIIAFVGMTGSGKSSAVDFLTEKGYPKVYFGGVIYDAMREAGIEITPESQTTFREDIRKKEGDDFVVKRIIQQINGLIGAGQHRIIADGIYSWTEYKIMKHEFPGELHVIAVVAPRRLRHHRLSIRPERPFTDVEATNRDWTEIENLEKGGPIAMADSYIINDGDMEHFHEQLDVILKHTDFYS